MRITFCVEPGCFETVETPGISGIVRQRCPEHQRLHRAASFAASKKKQRALKNPGRRPNGEAKVNDRKRRKLIPYAGFDPSEGRRW